MRKNIMNMLEISAMILIPVVTAVIIVTSLKWIILPEIATTVELLAQIDWGKILNEISPMNVITTVTTAVASAMVHANMKEITTEPS